MMEGDARFWRHKYFELLQTHTQILAMMTDDDHIERAEQIKSGLTQLLEKVKEAQGQRQANGAEPAGERPAKAQG